MAEAVRRLVGVLCGELGQGCQALVDGVLALFDKAVGEEDEGGAALVLGLRRVTAGRDEPVTLASLVLQP